MKMTRPLICYWQHFVAFTPPGHKLTVGNVQPTRTVTRGYAMTRNTTKTETVSTFGARRDKNVSILARIESSKCALSGRVWVMRAMEALPSNFHGEIICVSLLVLHWVCTRKLLLESLQRVKIVMEQFEGSAISYPSMQLGGITGSVHYRRSITLTEHPWRIRTVRVIISRMRLQFI